MCKKYNILSGLNNTSYELPLGEPVILEWRSFMQKGNSLR